MGPGVVLGRDHVLVDVLEEGGDALLREDRKVLNLPAFARNLGLIQDGVFLKSNKIVDHSLEPPKTCT